MISLLGGENLQVIFILFYSSSRRQANHCWIMICRCKVTPGCFLLQRKCRMRKLSISIVRPLQASLGLLYQCLQPGHDQSWRLSEGNNARDKRPVVVNGNKKRCPFHQFGERLVLGGCLGLTKWETSRLLYLLRLQFEFRKVLSKAHVLLH